MTRLIGFRCKHSNVFSREVLICPVSCMEFCLSQTIFLKWCIFLYLYIFMFMGLLNAPTVLVICRKGYTRSHSEHGSQAFLNRWYSARGRVGSRQHCGRILCTRQIKTPLRKGESRYKTYKPKPTFYTPSTRFKHTNISPVCMFLLAR